MIHVLSLISLVWVHMSERYFVFYFNRNNHYLTDRAHDWDEDPAKSGLKERDPDVFSHFVSTSGYILSSVTPPATAPLSPSTLDAITPPKHNSFFLFFFFIFLCVVLCCGRRPLFLLALLSSSEKKERMGPRSFIYLVEKAITIYLQRARGYGRSLSPFVLAFCVSFLEN